MTTKKRLSLILTAALLLLAGYWIWYTVKLPEKSAKSAVVELDTFVTDTSLTIKPITDTAVVREKTPVASVPEKAKAIIPDRPTKPTPPPTPDLAEPTEAPATPRCDQLVMRNGDLIDAKITEVGVSEIKYKKCNWPDGPSFAVSKSDVLSIRFADGQIERFTSGRIPDQDAVHRLIQADNQSIFPHT